jgi:predicted double-glycine peptidase
MKNPLNYQTTEYDCGPTTMINAISYLFKREEIPPDVIKHIVLYSLDSYNEQGEFGKSGTSATAMMFISNWLNQFGRVKKFPIHSEFLTGRDVFIGQTSKISASLQQGGAVVIRLMYGCWHYALLTGADENSVYLFDPYYRKRPFTADGLELITGAPTKMNRRVENKILNSEEKIAYALGPIDAREAIILFNENMRKTPEKTIEYFI